MIQPPTLEGALRYMGFEQPEEMGTDPDNGAWALRYPLLSHS